MTCVPTLLLFLGTGTVRARAAEVSAVTTGMRPGVKKAFNALQRIPLRLEVVGNGHGCAVGVPWPRKLYSVVSLQKSVRCTAIQQSNKKPVTRTSCRKDTNDK